MSEQAYEVVVTREHGRWLADVPGLQGARTYARSLPALDLAVREVIVLAADLPDAAMPGLRLDFLYHTGDPELDSTALEVGCGGRQMSSRQRRQPAPARWPCSSSPAACQSGTWPRCC